MASRRVIVSLLDNFLDSFVSRYTQYDGYWLFGFLVGDSSEYSIDLLAATSQDMAESPLDVAAQTARLKFADQIEKLRIDRRVLQAATLTIHNPHEKVSGEVDGCICEGYMETFLAQAVLDTGIAFESERILFVAPHNPRIERRSGRATA